MMGVVRGVLWLWLCAWAALYRWQAGKQYDHGSAAFDRGEALERRAVETRQRADDLRHSMGKKSGAS